MLKSITGSSTAVALEVLEDAIARCQDRQWTAVVVLGYRDGEVEIMSGACKSTDSLVGALERAKFELLKKSEDR
jgi:hypothetical protein